MHKLITSLSILLIALSVSTAAHATSIVGTAVATGAPEIPSVPGIGQATTNAPTDTRSAWLQKFPKANLNQHPYSNLGVSPSTFTHAGYANMGDNNGATTGKYQALGGSPSNKDYSSMGAGSMMNVPAYTTR